MATQTVLKTKPQTIERFDAAAAALGTIIVGKPEQIRLALCCLLAGGHLLIEDIPGVGKTTLAHALASVLGLSYQRIQFTSDLLPADILGVSVFRRDTGGFEFHRGPIFAQLILADEINRATPKAQSALLEAMEERQVTADGQTYALPKPFFVIATSNPTHQIGTFDLPESQLDRFLMRIEIGYPAAEAERALLANGERRDLINELGPIMSLDELLHYQSLVSSVYLADPLLDYVQAIIAMTRESGAFLTGLSPRAGIALVRAAQAWALMHNHDGVHPEDVQAVLPCIVAHRLVPSSSEAAGDPGAHILRTVPLP
jgi:MoxR-like ATPase